MERFYEILREEFNKVIQSKNGWGKNELMAEFDRACARAMAKYASELGISLT